MSKIVDRRRPLHVKEEKNGAAGHVYICSLGYDNLYKIGRTTNLARRLLDLGASNPKLKCIFSAMTTDATRAEHALHRIYKDCHVQREVFKIKHVDVKWLNRVIRKYHQKDFETQESPEAVQIERAARRLEFAG